MKDDFFSEMKEQSKKYFPEEPSQTVLRLKLLAKKVEFCLHTLKKQRNVEEAFLNACMQLAYNEGAKAIDQKSFEKGKEFVMREVAKKLGFSYDEWED